MQNPAHESCPDCSGFSRRDFMKTTALGAAALSGLGMGSLARAAEAGAAAAKVAAKPTSETLVASLYNGLTEAQKKVICYPFDHALRSAVDNNWFITDARVGKDFTADQQDLIKQIFMGLHSEEYAETVVKQVDHDSGGAGGLNKSSIAIFGTPGTGKFEFVLTGRHCTRRCDGDSVDGAAFGGPIFYGHAAASFNEKPDHAGNVYWYQAKRANELFQALDTKQREAALSTDARKESGNDTVKLAGKDGKVLGLPASDMSKDQRELLRKVMADVLAPFRKQDVEESMKLIEANDGFSKLAISYFKNSDSFKNADIGNDGVWDVWQIEGPNMVWYFRGSPHVHVWVNIKDKA
jgi:hypothetical protein